MSHPKNSSAPQASFPANHPPVVSRDAWAEAHRHMVAKEKAHMKAHDALVADRRRMPWISRCHFNEAKVATLFQPPWVQPVVLPKGAGLSYVRAVAYLADAGRCTRGVADLVRLHSV